MKVENANKSNTPITYNTAYSRAIKFVEIFEKNCRNILRNISIKQALAYMKIRVQMKFIEIRMK